MKRQLFLTALTITIGLGSCTKESMTADYGVIPLPNRIESTEGDGFVIRNSTAIVYPKENGKLQKTAELLSEYIAAITGMELSVTPAEKRGNAIVLKSNFACPNQEAYSLTVNDSLVTINGSSDAGTFYGVQTLRKSIPACSEGKQVLLPPVEITDMPRFSYRGMHLDVARHFFPADFIKRYIDILAMHNINRFHWHLSDDQGWRVEIKSYPKLTEVGQWRKETLIGRAGKDNTQCDGTPYGGYYTQEEIRDIVQYATDRFVTIIPEIDLPGHMLAALSAYPEYGCTGGPYEAATGWGIFPDILCMGNEKTYEFLENIFSEIMDLFPSEFIHVGGDEAPKQHWEECPKCQAKIKELGIRATKKHTAENQLQSYAVQRLEKFLNSRNREVIGWDEILEGGIGGGATVMSWRGTEGGIEAADLGHDAIMVPHHTLYFDYYQSEDQANEPLSIGGYIPVRKVYEYEPIPSVLTAEQVPHIIGLQANLWTEYIHTPEHVEYMLLPRLAALCEVQWTQPEAKNYENFLCRMDPLFRTYDRLGYNYAKHIREDSKVAFEKAKAVPQTAGQAELESVPVGLSE